MSKESKLLEEKINEKLNQSDAKGITLYDLYLAGKDNFYPIYNNLVNKNNKQLYKVLPLLHDNDITFLNREYVYDETTKNIYVIYYLMNDNKVFLLMNKNSKMPLRQDLEEVDLKIVEKAIKILSNLKDEHNILKNNLLCLKQSLNGFSYFCSSNSYHYEKVFFRDELLKYNFDLTDKKIFDISFINQEDFNVASVNDKLYDYFDFYKESFLRKVPLNINKLNPLYKNLLMNYLIEKDEKELILKK